MIPCTTCVVVLLASVGVTRSEVLPLSEQQARETRQALALVQGRVHQVSLALHHAAPVSATLNERPLATVLVTANLHSVLSLDDVRQAMRCSLTLTVGWQDSAVAWNSSDYHDVQQVEVPVDSLWVPELLLLNSGDLTNVMLRADHVSVNATGWASVTMTLITDTLCDMYHASFPYDTQTCTIIIHSYSSFVRLQLSLVLTPAHKAQMFVHRSEWELLEARARNLIEGRQVNRSLQALELVIERRTAFYTVCLVLPMVLTFYTNTLVFLVPLQAGEKVSFLVTLFVSTSVFSGFFSSVMPRGLTAVPSVMKLLMGVTLQSVLILLCTLLVMRRHHGTLTTDEVSDRDGGREETGTPRSSSARSWSSTRNKTGPTAPNRNKTSPTTATRDESGPTHAVTTDREREGRLQTATEGKKGLLLLPDLSLLTAERLDCGCFMFFFVANTVFLCVIYLE